MFELEPEEITEGPLGRALALLAVPVVAQQFVVIGQQLVDVLWLGRLSANAVAAVGLVAPLVGLLALGMHVAYTGGQVVVSRRVGAEDSRGANRACLQAVGLAMAVEAVLAVGVFFVADPLVSLFDPGPRVATLAAAYLVVLAVAHVFAGASDALEAGFMGWGDSRTPLVQNVAAVLGNLVLDPVLIFGWGPAPALGIRGAALATLLSYALATALGLGVALSGRSPFALSRSAFGVDPGLAREVASVGLPRAGQEGARQVARLVVVAVVSLTGGAAALAAYTVGARVASVAFVPAVALGQAATTVIGQNLGAARPDRASRATWLGVAAGVFALAVLGAVQWSVPEVIATVVVPGIAGLELEFTVGYLRILAYGYPALGAIYTVEAGFNGASRTRIPMVATTLQYWAVRVPLAALLAFGLGYGAFGPFWAVTASNVVAAVGLLAWFRHSEAAGLLDRAAESPAD